MSSTDPHAATGKAQQIVRWSLQGLLAAVFTAAAVAKLAGAPLMVETFEQIGIGQWFRYLTALVETSAAAALLTPRLAVFGASILAATMAVAVGAHLAILETSPAPAAVLMGLCLIVVWLRRAGLSEFPRRLLR